MLSRGQRFLFLAAAIAPALLPLFVIWRYGVNMPYMDEWDFIKDLHLANEQGRLLPHLFTQFNESRPALSRLLFLALAKLSAGDFRAPMLTSWLAACLISWNLWRLAKPANDALQLTAMAFVNLLIFSPIQYETWLWGNQVIVLLPILFLTSALRVLGNGKLSPWVSLASALTLGAAAMYSFSGGLFILPAIGVSIVFIWPHWDTHKRPAIAAWMLTFAICAGFYFADFITPPNHPGISAALDSPLQTARYFVTFLGSVHGNGEPFLAVLAGLALLAIAAMMLRRSGCNGSLQIVVGFVLISAAATALGRVGLGLEQALSYRYMSVSLYLTVGVVLLALQVPSRVPIALLVGALATSGVHGCIRGLMLSAADHRIKQYQRTCVSMSMHTTAGCSEYAPYPGWDFLRITAPTMERLGLFEPGLFAGDIPRGGEPHGTLSISSGADGTMRGTTSEPTHAILIAYRQEESVRWLGLALPNALSWESRLRIPATASEILAYGYNADSGKAVFLAKSPAPR